MNKGKHNPPMSEEVEVKNQMVQLIGYTPKERFKELKASYTIKSKNFEKKKSDDEDIKKLLEDVVAMIKTENKKMKVVMRYMSKTKGKQQFLELFPDKETKLKYMYKMPEDMEELLLCRLGRKQKILNLLLYRKKKVDELIKFMEDEICYIDSLNKKGHDSMLMRTISKIQEEVTSLEDKYRVNAYIQRHYGPIIALLEKEIRIYPIRIKNAETALKHNTKELEEVRGMHAEAKLAKDLAGLQMWKLQEDVQRDRQERGEVVMAVRKNMAQRYEALERLKKRKTQSSDPCDEESEFIDQSKSMLPVLREVRLEHYKSNDLFGTIKSTLLETRIMTACETILKNDEMNEFQSHRKRTVDSKFEKLQAMIKQENLLKVKMVQTVSNKREECRLATKELEDKIKGLEGQIEEKKKKLTFDGDLLMTVKKGIHAIGAKLSWLEIDGEKSGDSIESHIFNITARLEKMLKQYKDEELIYAEKQARQHSCLNKLMQKNMEIKFSEEDSSQGAGLTSFDEVIELNDNTSMVRNYMKAASKRVVAKQKRVLGRR